MSDDDSSTNTDSTADHTDFPTTLLEVRNALRRGANRNNVKMPTDEELKDISIEELMGRANRKETDVEVPHIATAKELGDKSFEEVVDFFRGENSKFRNVQKKTDDRAHWAEISAAQQKRIAKAGKKLVAKECEGLNAIVDWQPKLASNAELVVSVLEDKHYEQGQELANTKKELERIKNELAATKQEFKTKLDQKDQELTEANTNWKGKYDKKKQELAETKKKFVKVMSESYHFAQGQAQDFELGQVTDAKAKLDKFQKDLTALFTGPSDDDKNGNNNNIQQG